METAYSAAVKLASVMNVICLSDRGWLNASWQHQSGALRYTCRYELAGSC